MFQKYKKGIVVIVIIILLFIVYSMFLKKDDEPVLSTASAAGTQLSAENSELISLLSQLRSINLNREIFTDETFRSLSDFSVILIPEPVSRPNPFAPIGSEGTVPQVQNEDLVDISAGL